VFGVLLFLLTPPFYSKRKEPTSAASDLKAKADRLRSFGTRSKSTVVQ
jgi:hypothetical protein